MPRERVTDEMVLTWQREARWVRANPMTVFDSDVPMQVLMVYTIAPNLKNPHEIAVSYTERQFDPTALALIQLYVEKK
jgi:hypothetical protein